jgi:16S rRNA (guanine527-N7)-methyltransferase
MSESPEGAAPPSPSSRNSDAGQPGTTEPPKSPPPSEITGPPNRVFLAVLRQALEEMRLTLTPSALDHMICLFELLAEANERINLVADASPQTVAVKHIADSLLVLTSGALDGLEIESALDLGSGAGFPGLPLAIAHPSVRWLLIESTGKKARFIEDTAFALGLENVGVSDSRSEALAHNPVHRASRNLVVARGLTSCAALCELGLPFLRRGGRLVAHKGPEGPKELAEAAEAARVCGGTPRPVITASLPILGHVRTFISWDKTADTPQNYPRREGLAQQRPL